MIKAAYSSACFWIFDSLFADALRVMICLYKMTNYFSPNLFLTESTCFDSRQKGKTKELSGKAFKRWYLSDFLFCDSTISIFIHPAININWHKFQLENQYKVTFHLNEKKSIQGEGLFI